jgi:toxin ParE1/3/4
VTRSYVVSRAAAADLREITRYTVKQWGEGECRAYIAELEQCTEALAKGAGVYNDMSELYPGLRVAACGHHYIFCLPRADAPALVIAILHERMDIMVCLKARLSL